MEVCHLVDCCRRPFVGLWWRRSFAPLAGGLSAILFFLAIGTAPAQMIDQNQDGMSDIWEWMNATTNINIAPNADPDGDGVPNRKEAMGGTNPFDSNSYPHITIVGATRTNFSAAFSSVPGKVYQLQSITNLGGTNWLVETGVVVRAGSTLTLSAPTGWVMKYFRIAISDTNTDGSPLNDWEKYQLGLNPLSPFSNGTLDTNGQWISDHTFATNKLASQNVLTLSATGPVTIQPDPGGPPTDPGVLTVTRAGFPLNTVTVNLDLGGPGPGFAAEGTDHLPLPRSVMLAAGVSSTNIPVTPLADTNLHAPVIAQLQLQPGPGYSPGAVTNASVVIYPSATPGGTGLLGYYFTNSSTTYASTNNFNPASLITNRIDPVIDFAWGGTNPPPNLSNGLYSVRWVGQIQPQYSETYYFDVRSDDGCRLWIGDQLVINAWRSQSVTEVVSNITLQAGTRYDFKLEYLQSGGAAQAHLYWYSPSQPKQIIPGNCLYPTNNNANGAPSAPARITSALGAVAFLGQPFSFTVTAANTPLAFTATGLPPGLAFNSTNGVINGTPTLAGNYQVLLTATNAAGLGASLVDIQVIDTGSSVVREVWTNVPGATLADIPTGTPADFTNTLGWLEGITNFGINYGERVRGYFTAPVTGNFYFWISGSDSAQLSISDDGEPVNILKRASVSPVNGGAGYRQWNAQTNQQTRWLALVAGQRYYLEILHKAGTTSPDHWSVGWLQDPTGTNTTPGGIVPGYVLSRYYPLPIFALPGTLYSANLLAQNGVVSTATGSATLLESADGTQAILRANYSGLSAPKTGEHIHSDPYLNHPGQIMFDVDATPPQPDGSYVWNIGPVGTLQPADIIEIIREGKAYLNIHTANFPGGEINGHFTAVSGSQTFTPPPAPPVWNDDHTIANAVVRFLDQATFGASPGDIAAVQSLGYAGWISNQFALPVSQHLPVVMANFNPDPTRPYPSTLLFNTWWQQSITAPDQLRQRVAFALSEILVVSEQGVFADSYANALSSYYDTLLDNAFGNFRTLLEVVTLHPAMGVYLNMQGNDKGSIITGLHANENYAREINQLFSIGLGRMWPDGTLVLNSQNSPVPTYNQEVINGFAAAFTGWNYFQTNQANGRLPSSWYPRANYTNSMVLVPTHHDPGPKLVLNNVVLPPAWGLQSAPTNAAFDNYGRADLDQSLDFIFNHPNVGPFLCRQLIQRLVTSNPSRQYLYRVVQKFNDDGTGVRGNMRAVISAILLDYEARSTNLVYTYTIPGVITNTALNTYGKQREPLLRVTAIARAFPSPAGNGGTYSEDGTQTLSITTTNAHRLNNGDTIALMFSDTSGHPAPPNGNFSVASTGTNSFTVRAPNLLAGTYSQNTNVITVTISGHGLVAGAAAYLLFTNGGAASGMYSIITNISTSVFTVSTPDSSVHSGSCVLPRITAAGFTQSNTVVTVNCNGPHGLAAGEPLYVNFPTVVPPDGPYQVATIPDATHFTINLATSANQSQSSFSIYPLDAPQLTRSGNVSAQYSTWNMGYTDTGSTYNLQQTPLRAPTVFNFFYPDYQFPGALASAGMTTPEFQLSSDTGVALLMNFLEAGILNNSGNTNGLSSFTVGNGAIVLDVGPWLGTNYTANAGVSGLVDSLGSLLLAGELSNGAKSNIVSYVTNNFPASSATWQRDRVRAVVHQIVNSPDYSIQR
jgi:uncharacterized protein (DUF1800 family)